jgi:hypothetical protein
MHIDSRQDATMAADGRLGEAPTLPDGLVVVVKRECETCVMVEPVLADLEARAGLTTYTQDDPAFPAAVSGRIHDADLAVSWHHDIETVPTLLRVEGGREVARTVGWSRQGWEDLTGITGLGPGLPTMRPGCGSSSVDPDRVDELRVRFTGSRLRSRHVELAALEDPFEALFERGWSDGLPLVPPTPERVLRMLDGTRRDPQDVVAVVPPDLVECTVEKVAVNAVMAGCKPEYLPVVLAALEAVCNDTFNMHGILATTMPVGPVLVVNGPIRRRIGMNSGRNVLGQGNRAGLTIGRAVQLVVRNVGGGRPGEVDRAAHGNPGKLSFCFAEDEEGSPFTPLCTEFGHPEGTDTVTAFGGEGPRCVVDQLSRDPESLCRTLALGLQATHHPKLVMQFDTLLVMGPEHARVFAEAGWTREQVRDRIIELSVRPGAELVRGAGGMAEGMPARFAEMDLPKARPEGVRIVHAGGGAGLFSMMIGGWVNGAMGTDPVCRPVGS